MVKIRSFGKKNASTSQFLFQLFYYYSEWLFLPSVLFCFVVFCCRCFFFKFFLAVFLIIVFLFQFFCHNFFIENSTGAFSTLILHHEQILLFCCLHWRSILYMSRFNELGPLFPFQYRYLTFNSTSYHHYLSFNFIAIFYFIKNSLGGFV